MQKIIKTSAFFMVLTFMAFPLSVVETVSATGATCPMASTIVDFTPETVSAPAGAEQSLQDILTGASYTLNATADQTQDQAWNVVSVPTITINSKFIAKATSNVVVFGYYTNDSMSNFVPVFKTDAVTGHSEFDAVPTAPGTFSLNVPGTPTAIGFAIKTFDATGASMGDFATENFLNNNFEDRAIVYNPASTPDTYIVAFDDSTVGDNDFNDMVVEVTLPCPGIPTNIPPVANAGPDQSITLPNNSASLIGFLSTDADGSIASYHWSFVSGPTTVTPADGMMTTASPLVAGTYVFSLTVTDDKGATNSDDVQITVNPDPSTPPPVLGGAGLTNQDNNGGGNSGSGSTNTGTTTLNFTSTNTDAPKGEVLGAQTSCGVYASKYLKKNKKNDPEEVKKLQKFLNDHMKAGIKEDGVFGKDTDTFVRKFQSENKETVLAPWKLKKPTGMVYITTLAAINNAVCPDLKIPVPKDLVPPSQNPLF